MNQTKFDQLDRAFPHVKHQPQTLWINYKVESDQSILNHVLTEAPCEKNWHTLLEIINRQTKEDTLDVLLQYVRKRIDLWPDDIRAIRFSKDTMLQTSFRLAKKIEIVDNNAADFVKTLRQPGIKKEFNEISSIYICDSRQGTECLELISKNITFSNVTNIHIDRSEIGSTGIRHLSRSKFINKLTILRLGNNLICDKAIEDLSSSIVMKNLEELHLWGNRIGDKGVAALANSTYASNLRIIDMEYNNIGDAGAISISNSTHLDSIYSLDLAYNHIGYTGALALLTSSSLKKIKHLDLGGNAITEHQRELILSMDVGIDDLFIDSN